MYISLCEHVFKNHSLKALICNAIKRNNFHINKTG